MVQRFYRRFDVNPNGNCIIAGPFRNSDNFQFGLAYQSSDGKYYAGSDDGTTFAVGATGIAITADAATWHLIEIRVNASANPHLIDVSIDGVALGQHSKALAAADLINARQGNTNRSVTYDVYDDDFLESQTSADYPIGPGFVQSFVPNADGTHTFTSGNADEGTTASPTAGPAITSATTDVNTYVNARPIGGGATDATRLINQVGNPSPVQLCEVQFEHYGNYQPPRAVEVLSVRREASTGSGNSTFKILDNSVENTILAFSGAGSTTDVFFTKQYATMPADGAAWTLVRFNALRYRFGYSTDANPDQYWRGTMIEAEFPTDMPMGLLGGAPFGIFGRNQQLQLMAL